VSVLVVIVDALKSARNLDRLIIAVSMVTLVKRSVRGLLVFVKGGS
jgi:hypothetical protein